MQLKTTSFTPSTCLSHEQTDQTLTSLRFPYWNEGGTPCWDNQNVYLVSKEDYRTLCSTVLELDTMVRAAIDHTCRHPELMLRMGISPDIIPYIIRSWSRDRDMNLMGRFDLIITEDGGIKVMEFNADTPTTFIETANVGSYVGTQYNQNHNRPDMFVNGQNMSDMLQHSFRRVKTYLHARNNEHQASIPPFLHLTTCRSAVEDWCHISHYADIASKAGFQTKLIDINDIGLHHETGRFIDLEGQVIDNLYKLYPWEFILEDSFGEHLLTAQDKGDVFCLEPLWKYLASNKGLFAVMYALFPGHPNLLKTYFSDDLESRSLSSRVIKPMVGREGQNVQVIRDGAIFDETTGTYDGPSIIQEYAKLPRLNDRNLVVGGWVVNSRPGGFLVRGDDSVIMRNSSMSAALIIE